MPYIPLSQRGFGFRLRLEPTIPLALYPTRDDIYYQIINPDLYDFLKNVFSDKLTPEGDIYLDNNDSRLKFDSLVDLFYL